MEINWAFFIPGLTFMVIGMTNDSQSVFLTLGLALLGLGVVLAPSRKNKVPSLSVNLLHLLYNQNQKIHL